VRWGRERPGREEYRSRQCNAKSPIACIGATLLFTGDETSAGFQGLCRSCSLHKLLALNAVEYPRLKAQFLLIGKTVSGP